MALKNFSQFTPQTVLSATDFVVGYRSTDEIRTDLDSLTVAISGLLISKGFTPGGALGTIKRVNYRYTIDAGENLNAVSGLDDYGLYLSYTSGQLDVYRNGSHLVDGQDFVASNGTQVTGLSTMSPGDVIDIVTLSAAGITISLSGTGSVFTNHYRYTVPVGSVTVGGVDVSGPDDLGSTLQYSSPNLEVYLNGSHLVYGLDYTALNGSLITMSEGLSAGDVVDVSVISAYDIGGLATLSTGVFKLRAGAGIILNPANGVGDVTITGNTFALTGGNIILNVGSTRQFKTIQSALNSLSAYSLDTTANVTISADPETINEAAWEPLMLQHPNGDRIDIVGSVSTIKSINNPIVSVVTASGGTLSATFTVDPLTLAGGRTIQKDDLISIHSVSGRDAFISNVSYTGTDAAGHLKQAIGDNTGVGQVETFSFPVSGAWCILGAISGDGMIQTYLSVVTAGRNFTGTQPVVALSGNRLTNWPEVSGLTVQFGSPGSVVFSSGQPIRILSAFPFGLNNQHIVFNAGGATNTWLNVGDQIITCGQATTVQKVSSTAAVDVTTALRFTTGGSLSGFTNIFGPIPHPGLHFNVRTSWERYRGVFKVENVVGDNVTIAVPDVTWAPLTHLGTTYQWEVTPLPRYGIEKIGEVEVKNGQSAQYNKPITIHTTRVRSIGNYIPSNDIRSISNISFDFTYNQATSSSFSNKYTTVGLGLGYNPYDRTTNSSSVTLSSNVAFHNYYYGIYLTGSSVLTQTNNSLTVGVYNGSIPRQCLLSQNNSTFSINGFSFNGGYGFVLQSGTLGNALYGVHHAGIQWFSVNRSDLNLRYFDGLETITDYIYNQSSALGNSATATFTDCRFMLRQNIYTGIYMAVGCDTQLTRCQFYGNKKSASALPADQLSIWADYDSKVSLSYFCVYTGATYGIYLRFNCTATSERDIVSNTDAGFAAASNCQFTTSIGSYLNLYLFNDSLFSIINKSSLTSTENARSICNRLLINGSGTGLYIDFNAKYASRNGLLSNLASGFTSSTFNYLNIVT